jgi:hypothetical protein
MTRSSMLALGFVFCATSPGQENSRIASPATATGALERVVTGEPFVAESVTELVQTASDGSHVRHSATAVVARDSAGRTRYSQNLSLSLPGELRVLTIIRDPVAGVRYVIYASEKTALRESIRNGPPGREGRGIPPGPASSSQEAATKIARQAVASMLSAHRVGDSRQGLRIAAAPLGDRTIEGLVVGGASAQAEAPAGEIGNEKPLTFTAEAWYSNELGIVVMSKASDPLREETTFQLRQLKRTEPSPELFDVPRGYRVTGAGVSPERGGQGGRE